MNNTMDNKILECLLKSIDDLDFHFLSTDEINEKLIYKNEVTEFLKNPCLLKLIEGSYLRRLIEEQGKLLEKQRKRSIFHLQNCFIGDEYIGKCKYCNTDF